MAHLAIVTGFAHGRFLTIIEGLKKLISLSAGKADERIQERDMSTSDSYGDIDISPTAVASIVGQSVHQCYGVVGMARKGLRQLLSRDSSRRGVDVHLNDDGLVIDVYVILQYGVRIKVVAESIQRTVKYHVEKAMGQPVTAVNVYIQGLRVEEEK